MTDNQKKLVLEYCGWCLNQIYLTPPDIRCHPLDGNDMVEAIKKFGENNHWNNFMIYFHTHEPKEQQNKYVWLFGNPENFFSIFGEWLEVK